MKGFVLPHTAAEAAFFGAYFYPEGRGIHNRALALKVAEEQKLEGMLLHLVDNPKESAFRIRALAMMKMEAVTEVGALIADIPHVFFKGALSDPLFFGGVGKRGACDVDLCIASEYREEVTRRLQTLGYRQKSMSRMGAHSKERSFVAEKFRPTLDVHSAFVNPWAFRDKSAEVLARSQKYQTAWGEIQGPSPEDMLLVFAANLATDRCTGRVKFALDAHALLNRFSVDWEKVAQRARSWGCDTGLFALCRLLQVRFKREIPTEVKALKPSRVREAWLNRMLGLKGSSEFSIKGRFQTIALCDWALSESAFFPLHLANHYLQAYKDHMPGKARAQ